MISSSVIILLIEMMGISITLGGIIGALYTFAYRGHRFFRSSVLTCVVLVPVIAAVVQAARQDLAVSFAIVGVLHLLRFRTVARDSREFTCTLVAVTLGICVGVRYYLLAFIVITVVGFLIVAVERVWGTRTPSFSLHLMIEGRAAVLQRYEAAIATLASEYELAQLQSRSDGSGVFAYDVVLRQGASPGALVATLAAIEDTTTVSIREWKGDRLVAE
jgi:hypothetical protein